MSGHLVACLGMSPHSWMMNAFLIYLLSLIRFLGGAPSLIQDHGSQLYWKFTVKY